MRLDPTHPRQVLRARPRPEQRFFLRFGAVDYRGEVFVNGVRVLEHERVTPPSAWTSPPSWGGPWRSWCGPRTTPRTRKRPGASRPWGNPRASSIPAPPGSGSRFVWSGCREGEGLPPGVPPFLSGFGKLRLKGPGPGWGYGEAKDEEAFLREALRYVETACGSRLSGFCSTRLHGTFQEENGLLGLRWRPKVPPERVRAFLEGCEAASRGVIPPAGASQHGGPSKRRSWGLLKAESARSRVQGGKHGPSWERVG